MSKIIRSKRDTPFVQIDKTGPEDERLSWKAKGILAYILCKPDDWQIYVAELSKHARDGKDSTASGINELIKFGYIIRKRQHTEDGKFAGYDYQVFESPINTTVSGKSRHGKRTVSGKPVNGLSVNGKTENGKPATTNNNSTNNNLTEERKNESEHAKNPEKNPKKEKPELTAEATQPSKKVAPKKVSDPVHENDFPKDDSELTVENMVAIPEPSEVADGMFNYYTIGDGAGTLSMILSSLNIDSIHQIDFRKVCVGWALKYSDEPFTLRDWKNKSRKSLLNWIANEYRSNKFNQAKIKSLNNGKKRSSTDPLISSEAMEKAYRELMAEGYR